MNLLKADHILNEYFQFMKYFKPNQYKENSFWD